MDHGTTSDEVMAGTARAILEYGRGWMLDPATAERAEQLGLDGPFGFWTNGRAGVLGEVDGDVAAAAIGFMAPASVRRLWEHRPEGARSTDLAGEYAEAAARWGRRMLAGLPDADLQRLTALCDAVAAAALPSTGVLFAGWRAMDRPEDPAGAATVALNVLRELRGGAHLSAVHAVGLGPHGAIMAADDPVRGGQPGAERFGWSPPHPTPDPDRLAEAERVTDRICHPAYEQLPAEERAWFVEAVGRVRRTLDTA